MARCMAICCVTVTVLFGAIPDPARPDPKQPRPIAARDSVFIEDLTWIEVRDAMQNGTDTVIVASGGVEQNGPYLVTGKHNVILRATSEAIARKLTKTLVAPIIPFVPEGDIDPPTAHMKYPGTISVTEETFERLVSDVCLSLRTHGFKHIILIGDSGGNQTGMQKVADRLNAKRDRKHPARFYYIPQYYDYDAVTTWLEQQGVHETPEGLHDDFAITAMMMTIDPNSVRSQERIAANLFRINGVELAPIESTIDWGKRIVEFRAALTAKAFLAVRSK